MPYNFIMYTFYPHYSSWASSKLPYAADTPDIIEILNPTKLNDKDLKNISASIDKFNFALYQLRDETNNFEISYKPFCNQLGLDDLDRHLCLEEDLITKIFNDTVKSKAFYIPYTNKPINWHTDGYYNKQEQMVYSFLLHCSQPAFEGGENSILDPDQVFIYLMEQDKRFIDVLLCDDVMTIPENRKNGELIRPETSTAIFKVLNSQHDVLMRYSMRKKNIIFKQDALTQEALSCMDEFINAETSPHISIKLKAGQGIVSNNVLHKRTAFKDKTGLERLYYRARFYNRINIAG